MSKEIIKNPNHVKIFDTTLRDGFQTPGVNVKLEDRLLTAELLAKLRVDVIEAGFPIKSDEDFESVRAIALSIDGPIICALSRAREKEIERTWSAIEPAKYKGGARIHTFIATSKDHMLATEFTPKKVLIAAREAVRRAKEYTNDVEFSAEDATRSNFNFMMRVVLEAVDAGATTINIPDTVGYTNPAKYARLIKKVKRQIDQYVGEGLVVVSAHCHNDLGKAVTNTLAAMEAGARQAEVSINGIGERAGNAALEEIVANILVDPPYVRGKPLSLQIDPSVIFEASEFVEKATGLTVSHNKAVVGRLVFSHESGIHADKVMKNRKTYEIMDPAIFGNRKTEIILGAGAGHSSFVGRANELGFEIEDHDGLTRKVKEYGNRVRRDVSDTEFEKILADFTGKELIDVFTLKTVETYETFHHLNSPSSTSKIEISINSEDCFAEAVSEKGLIDSDIEAIKKATGLTTDFGDNFIVKSLGSGASAKAGVNLTIKDGIEVTAYIEDQSVHLAATKAYIAALNTIARTSQRKQASIDEQKIS